MPASGCPHSCAAGSGARREGGEVCGENEEAFLLLSVELYLRV